MNINTIRGNIKNNLGNIIKITYNEGRNKIFIYRGKIKEVYKNVFIIYDNKCDCKRCFSYYDVLTNTVRISLNDKK